MPRREKGYAILPRPGASVRIVVDVGDWDQSRWINAPGQSGDPRSPHYRDLAPLWADGHYVPLLYTRAAVDYLILYHIQEALNPGSLRRMEQRLKKEQGQEFILPPSEVVN